MQAEEKQTMLNLTITPINEQRDKSNRDAEEARYVFTRKPVTEYLEKYWSRLWAARAFALMEFCHGCFATVLNLDKNGKSPSGLSKSAEILLQTGRGRVAQIEHRDFTARDGELLSYLCTATSEASAPFYVTP